MSWPEVAPYGQMHKVFSLRARNWYPRDIPDDYQADDAEFPDDAPGDVW